MLDTQRESDLFCGIMSYCKDVAFEDIVSDENLIMDRADNNESLENLLFEYGLFRFMYEAFKINHPKDNNESRKPHKKDRAQIRKDILKMPLGDVLDIFKDGLETAQIHNAGICAILTYAKTINELEEIIGGLIDLDEETDNLLTEG